MISKILSKTRGVQLQIIVLVLPLIGITTGISASTQISQSPAPVVNGNTITVEPDGWYQFQRADNFVEVCSGIYTCTVTPGKYIVVNHTTGQRWDHIKVGGEPIAAPEVSGNRIVLGDDGWYQVQDGQTYASICEGVSYCDVPAGNYIVINHTTEQRFEPVIVVGVDLRILGIDAQRYSDSAGELFWQRTAGATAVTYEVYRDGFRIGETGGTSFFDDELEPSQSYLYEVLALETGARAEVTLEAAQIEQEPVADPQLNASTAEEIFKQVVSVINEDRIDQLFETAQADLEFQGRRFFLSNTTDEISFSQSIDLETPYQLETNYGTGTFTEAFGGAQYTCAGGGTIDNFGSDRIFNACSVGENTYSGISGRRNDQLRGTISQYPFYSFSVSNATGAVALLSGGYYTGNLSFVSLNQSKGWTDGAFLEITSEGVFLISEFNIERTDKSFNERGGINLEDGTIVNLVTENRDSAIGGSFVFSAPTDVSLLSVNVSLAFSDSTRKPVDTNVTDIPGGIQARKEFQWQTGSIEVVAEDGSSFTVVPSDTLSQKFTIELSNGESIGPIDWDGDYIIDCGSEEICP